MGRLDDSQDDVTMRQNLSSYRCLDTVERMIILTGPLAVSLKTPAEV